MPMSKARKATLKTDLAGRFQKANAAIVAEYRGLTVADLTQLRVKLRESKSEFKIIKNRVAKVAIREDSPTSGDLSANLKGPVGVVFVYGDPAAAAKTVLEFAKEDKCMASKQPLYYVETDFATDEICVLSNGL